MPIFADSETAAWMTAGGVILVAVLKWVGDQIGLFSSRKQEAVNEVIKGQGEIISHLQKDIADQGVEIKELRAENRELGRRSARLEREVIRLGGNPDLIDGSDMHEPLVTPTPSGENDL